MVNHISRSLNPWLHRAHTVFLCPNTGNGEGEGGNGNGAPPAPANGDPAASSGTPNDDAAPPANPNGEHNNSDGKPDEDKAGDGKGKKPDTFTLTKDDLTKRIDAAVDRAKSRWEGQQAQAAADKATADAKTAGDITKLEEGYQAQLAVRDAEIKRLEGEIIKLQDEGKVEGRKAMIAQIAKDANLPDELRDLLQGDTEAELKTHAEKLSKVVGPPKAPKTENGKPANGGGSGGGSEKKPGDWQFNQGPTTAW